MQAELRAGGAQPPVEPPSVLRERLNALGSGLVLLAVVGGGAWLAGGTQAAVAALCVSLAALSLFALRRWQVKRGRALDGVAVPKETL
jgi:hypothetical protein